MEQVFLLSSVFLLTSLAVSILSYVESLFWQKHCGLSGFSVSSTPPSSCPAPEEGPHTAQGPSPGAPRGERCGLLLRHIDGSLPPAPRARPGRVLGRQP